MRYVGLFIYNIMYNYSLLCVAFASIHKYCMKNSDTSNCY